MKIGMIGLGICGPQDSRGSRGLYPGANGRGKTPGWCFKAIRGGLAGSTYDKNYYNAGEAFL